MNLRVRVLIIFILSIIISVLVFLISSGFLLKSGLGGGLSEYDMEQALERISTDFSASERFDLPGMQDILSIYRRKYEGMEFEVLSEKLEVLYTTYGHRQKYTLGELAELLSKHSLWMRERLAAAKEIRIRGEVKGYMLVSVPRERFISLRLYLSNANGVSLMGLIFLTGLVITLVVSSIFASLFTYRISRRFTHLYKAISSFELGNLDVKIGDKSGDELGKLASIFNGMAEKLKVQLEQEKEYQQERQKLVSNISHDLRTPLTSIVGYAESLENGIFEGEEEWRKYISIIHRRARYMEKLLGELLDFSRLESGGFEVSRKSIDLAELCRETLIEYIPLLQEKGMELHADIPDRALVVYLDKDRISRALRNIIDNAVKYGAGGKYLRLGLLEKEKEVVIEVQDKGMGVDPENLDKIFKRFYRGDKARNSKDGGMGLGLSIALEIVRRHDGDLRVQSQPGKGSTFMLVLPKSG